MFHRINHILRSYNASHLVIDWVRSVTIRGLLRLIYGVENQTTDPSKQRNGGARAHVRQLASRQLLLMALLVLYSSSQERSWLGIVPLWMGFGVAFEIGRAIFSGLGHLPPSMRRLLCEICRRTLLTSRDNVCDVSSNDREFQIYPPNVTEGHGNVATVQTSPPEVDEDDEDVVVVQLASLTRPQGN